MSDYISLNIEVTDNCNLNCSMCDQAISGGLPHGNEKGYISKDTWNKILDSLEGFDKEIHISAFWLGEPLMHPEFESLIRTAFERNHKNHLFRDLKIHTNGVLLSEKRTDAILDCASMQGLSPDTFTFLHCSIEAVKPETYKLIKGGDFLEIVKANLLHFLDMRAKRKLSFPKLTVAFIVTEENREEARDFLETWSRVFKKRGLEFQVTGDWPPKLMDTIYFRRLNSSDQEAADMLHQEVLSRLNITSGRIEESF
ncbi:MAG: radical SAM protein [Deltaproteobacteria bacterium]|nr:radical SAM protein [Deltaproteobacteria bacterium]